MFSSDRVDAGSRGNAVLQLLQKKIISGELKPGEWLMPEREMAEQMGISRGSLHQAILALEYQGFVSIIPRRGTMVCDYRKHPTPQSLSVIMSYGSTELDESIFGDMMNFRIWMESECARLACTNIYESTVCEMESIVASLLREDADRTELIYRFHYRLTQASGNSIFSMIFRGFESTVKGLTEKSYAVMGTDINETAEKMRKLLSCIKAKDEQSAAAAAVELLSHGISQLKTQYK